MSVRRWCAVAAACMLLLLAACAPNPYELAVPDVTVGAPGVPVASPEPSPDPAGSLPVAHPAPASPVTEPELSPETSPEPTPTPEDLPPAAEEEPAPEPLFVPGERAERIRELQHRLLQISWLSGEITDTYDQRTRSAVDGFQSKRGLPILGYVDQETWDRLLDMTREPTHDELHNIRVAGPTLLERGDKGDEVRDLQARLQQIRWFHERVTENFGPATEQAVRGFQGKRELPVTGAVDQATLDALYDMTRQPTAEELSGEVRQRSLDPSALDPRCMTGRVACISKGGRQLAWVVDGKVQFTTDVRFGSELTPTREGVFQIGWKSRDHVSSIYHSPMPYALFFSGGQAIHYSDDFRRNGYNGASYGCVNIRDKDVARTLFEISRVGDKVVVY